MASRKGSDRLAPICRLVHSRRCRRQYGQVAGNSGDLLVSAVKMVWLCLNLVAVLIAGACNVAHKDSPKTENHDGSKSRMSIIEIVPGISIGDVRVGAPPTDLPKRARIVKEGSEPIEGQLDEIHFVFDGGIIADAWIDLRKVSGEVHLRGRTLHQRISLEDLKQLLGPCERIVGKGAIEYRCVDNLRIATDFGDKGNVLRIHLTWPPTLP
jgi:hypothetical protein